MRTVADRRDDRQCVEHGNVTVMNRDTADHLCAEQSILMSPSCIAPPWLIPGKLNVYVMLYIYI